MPAPDFADHLIATVLLCRHDPTVGREAQRLQSRRKYDVEEMVVQAKVGSLDVARLRSDAARQLRALRMIMLAAVLAVFAVSARAQQVPDYHLNAGDTLDVEVWKEVDLTKTVIVRPDGKFSFPLAGEVAAAGRTVAQIQTEIAQRLVKYIPEPVVSVAVKTLDGCRIYVIGQVNKPGSYIMNPRVNVLQALSIAGGMTAFAATNDITVLRGDGANQKSFAFRYGDVSKGRNLNQNFQLEAGDVVIVP